MKGKGERSDEEDLLKYRPNPDMMDTKSAPDGQVMFFTCLLMLYTCYSYIPKEMSYVFFYACAKPPT